MFIFWSALLLITYAYFGYPLFLILLARINGKNIKKEEISSGVTLIIAAYNEEKVIRNKIENSLNLDYPKDKLEIIVVSDCSSDNTDAIVGEYTNRGVRLLRLEERGGKVKGHREAVKAARGDILVFSDATGIYEKDAIRMLVRNFADSRVGCVGGMLQYSNPNSTMLGSGEGLYWKYEVMLRKKESSLGKLPAVSGSIYAVRKHLYGEFPEYLADDLVIPLLTQQSMMFSIYEPKAICVEEVVATEQEEFAKRARIANQNINGIIYMRALLNPLRYRLTSFILISHKILRQLVPIALILLYGSNAILAFSHSFYRVSFIGQNFFYVMAALGAVIYRRKYKCKLFNIPFYFCTTNIGISMGIIRYFLKRNAAVWQPVRR